MAAERVIAREGIAPFLRALSLFHPPTPSPPRPSLHLLAPLRTSSHPLIHYVRPLSSLSRRFLDLETLYAEMDGDTTSAWSSVPPDASSAPVRPRPYGALYDPAHSAHEGLEGELRNMGDLGDDDLGGDALDIEELEALLADSGAEEPLYADSAAEAAAMADEASATYEPGTRGGKGATVSPAMKTIPNALAGDQVDDDLASLVAKLDAPAELAPSRSAAKRVAAAAAADEAAAASAAAPAVASPAADGDGDTKKAAAKRAKRKRSGPPPAWFVNVDKVDFGGLLQFGKLGALSVKELKSFLYGREADLSGTKKELVSRVEAELRRGDASSGGGAAGGGGNGGKSGDGGAGGGGAGGGGGTGGVAGGAGGAAVAVARGASGNGVKNGASKSSPRGRGAAGRGRGRASAGRGAGGDETAELNTLASLPPPDGEDEPLSLFDSNPSTTDAADDFLIDEVFSAMY